ncbi:MAG: hypothetical protein D8M58_21700 [Calditrichaeota bacterium]|nr:MAG: hypothetical protein DWQ03_00775 [Calditrichota bacterium]MBL1208030.1 hypothetical protein [Calditrichota bacterium]NOG47865.1 hypothetical protein [Calditrichota bacterium]
MKIYWVRKKIFKCGTEEFDDYYNWIDKNFIVYGFGDFHYSELGVDIPVHYLEKGDLLPSNPYKQVPDWQKTPWIAPAEAVAEIN